MTRVDPGTSEIVDVSITATGSRTANWNITYDTSNLPPDWNVVPQAGTNLQEVELVPASPVSVPFVATLPTDALGDEDGYIEITATLVSDPSVQTSMWIPIEALELVAYLWLGQPALLLLMVTVFPDTPQRHTF